MGNLFVGRLENIGLPAKPAGEIKLFFDEMAIDDL